MASHARRSGLGEVGREFALRVGESGDLRVVWNGGRVWWSVLACPSGPRLTPRSDATNTCLSRVGWRVSLNPGFGVEAPAM